MRNKIAGIASALPLLHLFSDDPLRRTLSDDEGPVPIPEDSLAEGQDQPQFLEMRRDLHLCGMSDKHCAITSACFAD